MKTASLAMIALLFAGQAFAADAPSCPLQEVMSLDTLTDSDGFISIPVKLDGKPFIMGVDTGSVYTSVKIEAAEELNLPLDATWGASFLNNVASHQMANLHSLTLGRMEVSWPVLVTQNFVVDPWQAGLIGQDVLSDFDLEIDYYHSKLNFFMHNTCTTDAAYWAKGPVAVVPFEMDRNSHIVMDAVLDGKKIGAMLDTGSDTSTMSLEAAQEFFGIRSNDPRLKTLRQAHINGGASATISAFPFSTLNLEGVAISNPQIDLVPKSSFGNQRDVDVILGANVLRRLRMYIAYQQKKVYLTDAEAH